MQPDPGSRKPRRWAVIVICAVTTAACGAAFTGWRHSHRHVALQHASCGSAVTHFLTAHTQFLSADPGSLTCFVRAARHCAPASIAITAMGVDSGTDYVFIITAATPPCQVTEQRQDYSANFGGSHSAVSTVQCRRVAVTPDGVTLSCRGQRLLLPAQVS